MILEKASKQFGISVYSHFKHIRMFEHWHYRQPRLKILSALLALTTTLIMLSISYALFAHILLFGFVYITIWRLFQRSTLSELTSWTGQNFSCVKIPCHFSTHLGPSMLCIFPYCHALCFLICAAYFILPYFLVGIFVSLFVRILIYKLLNIMSFISNPTFLAPCALVVVFSCGILLYEFLPSKFCFA